LTAELWVAIAVVAIPAFASVVVAMRNSRKLSDMHVLVNSRLSELLSVSARAERAEGVTQATATSADIKGMVDSAIALAMAESSRHAAEVAATLAAKVAADAIAEHATRTKGQT